MIGALVAHGVDLGNGRSNVQHLSAEARRVRAHFSFPRSKGLSLSPSSHAFVFCFVLPCPRPRILNRNMSRRH